MAILLMASDSVHLYLLLRTTGDKKLQIFPINVFCCKAETLSIRTSSS